MLSVLIFILCENLQRFKTFANLKRRIGKEQGKKIVKIYCLNIYVLKKTYMGPLRFSTTDL